MGNDAQVTVGADASAVERAAAAVKTAWEGAGTALQSAIGGAARSVVSSLAEVAISAGKINFAAQHEQVKAFESSTAHMAVAMGRDLESVRAQFIQTGGEIGKRPTEVAAWTNEVGKLTYNFDGAGKAMKGMSELASATGRNVEDYRGLAVELNNVGKVTGDTSHAIGVMAAQADKLGVSGGIAAFADQIEDLSGTMSMFAMKGEQDLTKITALAGELGKGLSPQAAGRVQQQAFGAIASDPLRWERYLGKQITDEHGHVGVGTDGKGMDPAQVMKEITEKTKRRYGNDARRVMMLNFGAEAGAAMFNANYAEAASAAGIGPAQTPAQKQAAYLQTDAGKRDQAAAKLETSSISLMSSSSKLGTAADAMQRFAASNPITSSVVAGALSTGASSALGGIAKALTGGGGVGGAAKGLGGGAALGVAGLALGAGLAVASKMEDMENEANAFEQKQADSYGDFNEKNEKRRTANRLAKIGRLEKGGLSHGLAVYQADHPGAAPAGGGGAPGAQLDTKEIARAVREGMKDAKIVNMTSPVEVAAQSSQSSAAGNQSGG